MKAILFSSLSVFIISGTLHAQRESEKSLLYLGQDPPGKVPVKFAPGLVSLSNQSEFGSVFSEDGKEFYYGVDINRKAETRYMKLVGNEWTEPKALISHDAYSYNDPFLSPDESKLFFISDMPIGGSGNKKDYDIWYIERKEDSWSVKPINAGSAINSNKNEYYVSFSKNGTMYFSSNKNTTEDNHSFDIYTSAINNGEFQKSQRLSESINTQYYEADVFVAYDESYLIFCGDRPEGYGKGDLYISFKNQDGTWSKAKNMGQAINTSGHELCPFVTRDGKYFFYTSNQDIYWVDASVIKELR